MNFPFEHCQKKEKMKEELQSSFFYTQEYMAVLKKINKLFTISCSVLTIWTIMLKKLEYRFKTLKCQEQNAKKTLVSISIFPIIDFTKRTKVCIIVDV